MADVPVVQAKQRPMKVYKSDIPAEKLAKIAIRVNEALDKFQIEKDISTYVKKKCDEELGGTWHCVAGRNFGCSITHETKYALFFQIELMHFLLFKSLE
eukprot:gene29957-39768_t